MKVAIIICLTIIICVFAVVLPTLQEQRYKHLEEMQEKDYELAQKQIELEKEKIKWEESKINYDTKQLEYKREELRYGKRN